MEVEVRLGSVPQLGATGITMISPQKKTQDKLAINPQWELGIYPDLCILGGAQTVHFGTAVSWFPLS